MLESMYQFLSKINQRLEACQGKLVSIPQEQAPFDVPLPQLGEMRAML